MTSRLTGGNPPSAQLAKDLTAIDQLTDADQIAEICAMVANFIENQDTEQLVAQITEFSSKFSLPLPLLKSVSRGLVTIEDAAATNGLTRKQLYEDLIALGVNDSTSELVVSQKELWRKLIRPASRAAPDSPAPAQSPSSSTTEQAPASPATEPPAQTPPAAATSAAPVQRQARPKPAADVGPVEAVDPNNILTINELVDMQWRFGLTTGNSEIRRVGESFLQMKLTIDQGNGTQKIVRLELTLPQFYEFLRQMEKAKTMCDFFA